RVHEMHADETVGPRGRGRQFGDRNRGGVGGENGFRAEDDIQFAQQRQLDVALLGHGLDRQLRAGGRLGIHRRRDALQRQSGGAFVELALRHLARQVLFDGGAGFFQRLGVGFNERHLDPELGQHMGNAVAHGAATDDRNLFNFHACPCDPNYMRSMAMPTPLPPPRQRAAMPRLAWRRSSSNISVTRMRQPLAPMGWPSATAPPLALTRSGFSPSSRISATPCTEKASFNSYRSTSSAFQPVLAHNLRTVSTGVIITHFGSRPLTAWATMRNRG